MRQHLQAALALIRQRGYAIAANGAALHALRQTATPIQRQRDDDAFQAQLQQLIGALSPAEIQLLDLADAEGLGISYISTPIFSPAGSVALELALSGLPAQLSRAQIEEYAAKLQAAAAVVISETHGRWPQT